MLLQANNIELLRHKHSKVNTIIKTVYVKEHKFNSAILQVKKYSQKNKKFTSNSNYYSYLANADCRKWWNLRTSMDVQ